MKSRMIRWSPLALGVTLMLFLSSCGNQSTRPLTTWSPKGKQATEIDDLSRMIFIIAGVVGVLVFVILGSILLRYRRRKGDEDGIDEPEQVHGNNRLETLWTIVPAVILFGLAVFNVKTIWSVQEVGKNPMKIEVVGQQWWWEFRYHDGGFSTDPTIITANQMVIPVDTDIELGIRSRDVIHSFWIPALNGKRDAVPGRTQPLIFHATKTGTFAGQCTEFCGLSHGYMQMEVKVLSQADFAKWVDDQTALPKTMTGMAAEGQKEFESRCAYCHQVNGLEKAANGKPNPNYKGLQGTAAPPLLSQNAPNLTHLMSRHKFAGNMFNLYLPDGTVDSAMLEAWLRAPDQLKPMNNARPGNAGNEQGMPNLGLDQPTIDKLVAYLTELK